MLKLQPNPTFFAKVMVPVPGGKAEPVKFEFRHKTRDQLASWLKSEEERDDTAALLEIAVGWDLADPFNAENVGFLVQNYIGSAKAVVETYLEELTKARLGN